MWVGWLKQSPPPPPLWSAPLCNEERLQSSSTCLKFLPVVRAATNRSEVSGGRPVGVSVQRGRRLLTRCCEFVLPAPPRHLQSLTYWYIKMSSQWPSIFRRLPGWVACSVQPSVAEEKTPEPSSGTDIFLGLQISCQDLLKQVLPKSLIT